MGGGPVGLGHIFAAPWVRVHALRNARGRPLMSNPATMNAAAPTALGRLPDWLHHPAPAAPLGCFARAYGLLLAAFAHSTLANYLNLLELTSLTFPFAPFDRLPVLPVLPAPALTALRRALVGCGAGLAAGVAPRPCLLAAAPLLVYFTQLDRTLYNNHCAPRPSR